MATLFYNNSIQTWISALTGAAVVGLVGFLPLFLVPNEQSKSNSKNKENHCYLFEY